jgi:hypothetical protein
MVFQPLQSGQRPSHRGDWWPQAWQEKLVFARIQKSLNLEGKPEIYSKG